MRVAKRCRRKPASAPVADRATPDALESLYARLGADGERLRDWVNRLTGKTPAEDETRKTQPLW